MEEISVLDYLKFKLNPKNFGKEILPEENPDILPDSVGNTEKITEKSSAASNLSDLLSGQIGRAHV